MVNCKRLNGFSFFNLSSIQYSNLGGRYFIFMKAIPDQFTFRGAQIHIY